MTEYEIAILRETILQTINGYVDNQASHVAIYLSILFAYCSVAYVVGRKLTRLQLFLATCLFIAAAGREVFAIVVLGHALQVKLAQLAELSPVLEVPGGATNWYSALTWSAGIVLALVFMWSVRRQKPE